jgi:hypothetical protein
MASTAQVLEHVDGVFVVGAAKDEDRHLEAPNPSTNLEQSGERRGVSPTCPLVRCCRSRRANATTLALI